MLTHITIFNMKNILIIVFLFSFTVHSQLNKDTWEYKTDKQIHAYIGFGMGVVGTSYLLNKDYGYGKSILFPIAVSTVPILAKEGVDYFTTDLFSIPDIGYGYIGAIQGSISTAGAYGLSEWMLKKKRFGSKDSYSFPAFVAGGYYFMTDLALWAFVPKYNLNPINLLVQTGVQSINMWIKYMIDKRNGRLERENFKL